jgi:hypothetical protein
MMADILVRYNITILSILGVLILYFVARRWFRRKKR